MFWNDDVEFVCLLVFASLAFAVMQVLGKILQKILQKTWHMRVYVSVCVRETQYVCESICGRAHARNLGHEMYSCPFLMSTMPYCNSAFPHSHTERLLHLHAINSKGGTRTFGPCTQHNENLMRQACRLEFQHASYLHVF